VFKILDDSGLIVGNMLTTFEKEFAWTLGFKKKKKEEGSYIRLRSHLFNENKWILNI
jgi:hypothetical protein